MQNKSFVISAYFHGTSHRLEEKKWLINHLIDNTVDDSDSSDFNNLASTAVVFVILLVVDYLEQA